MWEAALVVLGGIGFFTLFTSSKTAASIVEGCALVLGWLCFAVFLAVVVYLMFG